WFFAGGARQPACRAGRDTRSRRASGSPALRVAGKRCRSLSRQPTTAANLSASVPPVQQRGTLQHERNAAARADARAYTSKVTSERRKHLYFQQIAGLLRWFYWSF